MNQYGRAQYWEERYSRDPEPFDWYQRYFSLRDIIGANVPTDYRILNVGSGNSRLSEEMFDDGYQSITNIDISQASIKTMNEKYKQKGPNFKYVQMDVRAMDIPQNSFDAVIDKGTFDSVLCGQGSYTNSIKMLTEIYRVLSPNGVYIMISSGHFELRQMYLEKKKEKSQILEFDWTIKQEKLPKPTITATISQPNADERKNFHYIYICTKNKKEQPIEPV